MASASDLNPRQFWHPKNTFFPLYCPRFIVSKLEFQLVYPATAGDSETTGTKVQWVALDCGDGETSEFLLPHPGVAQTHQEFRNSLGLWSVVMGPCFPSLIRLGRTAPSSSSSRCGGPLDSSISSPFPAKPPNKGSASGLGADVTDSPERRRRCGVVGGPIRAQSSALVAPGGH